MRPVFRHAPMRFRHGGVVALVVLASALLGADAGASCGDWLEGHGQAMAGSHDAAPGAAGERLVPTPLQGRRPCTGPSCGRAPAPLPLVPGDSPVIPIDLDQAAILASGSADDPSGLDAVMATDEPVSSSALSGRPERPPRG